MLSSFIDPLIFINEILFIYSIKKLEIFNSRSTLAEIIIAKGLNITITIDKTIDKVIKGTIKILEIIDKIEYWLKKYKHIGAIIIEIAIDKAKDLLDNLLGSAK